MKKLPIFIFALMLALVCVMPACNKDDDTSKTLSAYQEWLDKNNSWLEQQKLRTNDDGTPYFKAVIAPWNSLSYVLIHYFNDRAETEGNLSPMYTSTIDTRYYVTYYDGTPLDSSTNLVNNGVGIFRTRLDQVIEGWGIAFQDMRVGDTAEVVIPFQQAYGVSTTGSVPPYSNLKYNVSLVDIYAYEVNPK